MSTDINLTTRGAVAALVIGTLAAIQPTTIRAEDGAHLVDDLHAVFGKHHARAVHAKGVILEGNFAPAKAAHAFSNAAVFAGATVPVTIRFSDFTGIPDIPDNIGDANPRGLAIKFRAGGDADMDVVTHSFDGFPTATASHRLERPRSRKADVTRQVSGEPPYRQEIPYNAKATAGELCHNGLLRRQFGCLR